MAQAYEVKKMVASHNIQNGNPTKIKLIGLKTTGDRFLDRPLSELGGKGAFTKELDEALLDFRIDLAVHSMKDVPTYLPEDISLPCMLERSDVRDAMISSQFNSFSQIPKGGSVGTASMRRQSQILNKYPDLRVTLLRGNIETRLKKLREGEVDATILAVAGLKRLGYTNSITSILEPEELLPAVGQGAIGVTCRTRDPDMINLLSYINHKSTFTCVNAERAMLMALDGSCRSPIGGLSTLDESKENINICGLVAEGDGSKVWLLQRNGKIMNAEDIGSELGRELRKVSGK